MINISGLDKAAVLAALYNRSHPQGMGFLKVVVGDMAIEEAAQILEQHTEFDYLFGRVMKVDLSGDAFDEWGYDRDNGQGAAQMAVDAVREAQEAAK